MKPKTKKILLIILFALVLIQFVPIDRTNPPVTAKVNWDSEFTEATFKKACADCHSNETKWPWYSYIAPVSYLIVYDVNQGRNYLNVSENKEDERDEAAREVRRGTMPMKIYTVMHGESNLNDSDRVRFIEGLMKTFGDNDKKDEKYKNQYN